jgi:hypothetical protein
MMGRSTKMKDTDTILEPEGSIRIEAVGGTVTLYFVFDGDWASMYNGEPESEKEARAWFVQEVERALGGPQVEASDSGQTDGPSGSED